MMLQIERLTDPEHGEGCFGRYLCRSVVVGEEDDFLRKDGSWVDATDKPGEETLFDNLKQLGEALGKSEPDLPGC